MEPLSDVVQATALDRIASALERIAVAMETKYSPSRRNLRGEDLVGLDSWGNRTVWSGNPAP